MAVRVLVVDDSGFFRRRLGEILGGDSDIEVIGMAVDGKDAIAKTEQLRPDVITMDIEMPVMDGITAVREIMAKRPTPVLMFSSLTHEGATATLEALEAGAVDFLPKQFEDICKDRDEAKQLLRSRVRALSRHRVTRPVATAARPAATTAARGAPAARPAPAAAPRPALQRSSRPARHSLVVIGTSTGGPAALQNLMPSLPKDFPAPILVVQHMPATFTPAFAARLDQMCGLRVKQADDGDVLLPGNVYVAPGGRQLLIEQVGAQVKAKVVDGDASMHYRPSVDITFASAARTCPGRTLAIVLTGMGADGREGARLLKQGRSTVWAQDEASCVIYGMPAAVVEGGYADKVLPLNQIAAMLVENV